MICKDMSSLFSTLQGRVGQQDDTEIKVTYLMTFSPCMWYREETKKRTKASQQGKITQKTRVVYLVTEEIGAAKQFIALIGARKQIPSFTECNVQVAKTNILELLRVFAKIEGSRKAAVG